MNQLPQALLSGLAPGSLFALVGVGFVIIYRATRVLNFVQGQFALLGAFAFYTLSVSLHQPPLLAALLLSLGAVIFGGAIYLGLLAPLTGQGPLIMVMVTLILGTILNAIIGIAWGAQPRILDLPSAIGRAPFPLPAGLYMSRLDVVTVVVALVGIGAIAVALKYTNIGLAMRAAASNPLLASYVGVSVATASTLAWAIATLTASFAGVFYGFRTEVDLGAIGLGLAAFPAVLIGGLDSIAGALVGALILGILESLAATYLGGHWTDFVAYGVLLVVLMLRPYGLFGSRELQRL
jgi:branched-chain amino acid transport system permease protein